MDNSELESFLTKFRCLWNSGFDAHLELDSHAGQSWVSMRVLLGHAPGPLQPPNHIPYPPNSTRNGPSRQRRRARRAAARSEQLVENEHVEKASEVEAEQVVFQFRSRRWGPRSRVCARETLRSAPCCNIVAVQLKAGLIYALNHNMKLSWDHGSGHTHG